MVADDGVLTSYRVYRARLTWPDAISAKRQTREDEFTTGDSQGISMLTQNAEGAVFCLSPEIRVASEFIEADRVPVRVGNPRLPQAVWLVVPKGEHANNLAFQTCSEQPPLSTLIED